MEYMPDEAGQNNDQHNSDRDEQWRKAWNEPEELGTEKKGALLNSIHRRISRYRRRKAQLYIIGLGAAAAMIVAVFIRIPGDKSISDINKWKEFVSNDISAKIILEDGSVLWLAPHSSVRIYPEFLKQ